MTTSLDDLLDVIQGRQKSLTVAAEIEDPESPLHRHLRDLEKSALVGDAALPNDQEKPLLPVGDIGAALGHICDEMKAPAPATADSSWVAAALDAYCATLDEIEAQAVRARLSSAMENPASILAQVLESLTATPAKTATDVVANELPGDANSEGSAGDDPVQG